MNRKLHDPLKLEIIEQNNLQELVDKINHQINVKENILQISKQVKNYPLCTCGNPIYFPEMTLYIQGKILIINKPSIFEHIYNDNHFVLCKCYDCIKEHFQDDMPSMQRYLFQLRYRWAKFAYNIPEEIHQQIRSDMCAVTLESCIRKHGKEKGKQVYEGYCRKQSETNTFEYKQAKYGWTKEQFDEFNKSRACTIENLIERHGEKLGKQKWENYVNRQKETKSWEYMVEKFGEEKAQEINRSKAVTLNTYIRKYGEIEGRKQWELHCKISQNTFSEASQELFKEIDIELKKRKLPYISRFYTKNGEYHINCNNQKTYFLDYYIPELNVCVEYNGNYWHANPNDYDDDYIFTFRRNSITAKQIREADQLRYNRLAEQGIRTIVVWESEYKSKDFDINKLVEKILQK